MNQHELHEHLNERLSVATGREGIVYVILDGIPLGRVSQDEESGHWICEWRSTEGWSALRGEATVRHPELAEGWAVDQIASMFAIDMGGHFGYDGPS